VAHRAHMTITGMDQMMSGADVQRAREGMKQLQEQLAHMPAEQRAMIEAQLAPQLAQFEEMLSSESITMEVRVTDVSFD